MTKAVELTPYDDFEMKCVRKEFERLAKECRETGIWFKPLDVWEMQRLLATAEAAEARVSELEKEIKELATMVEGYEQAAEFKPEETAPKDGRLLELLVEDGDNRTENEDLWRTIGHNQRDCIGEDVWEVAGWNWSHDFWHEARNFRVVGWREVRPATDPHFMTPWCTHTQNTLHQRLLDEAAEFAQHEAPRGTVGSVFNEHTALMVSTLERAAALVAKPQVPTPPVKGEENG